MKTACVVVPVILAVAAYFLLPDHGHGDFLNPLRVTDDPLVQYNQDNFTRAYINGHWNIVPVYHKPLKSWDDVVLAPIHSGWGDNKDQGVRAWRMSDELVDKVCEDFEVMKEQVNTQTDVEVVEHTSPHGGNPVGCGACPRRQHRNLAEKPLSPAEALYFNSDFLKPEKLSEAINTPTVLISSFFSEYDRPLLSAVWHNALTPSIAVTCTGSKWWTFAAPRAIGKYGARGMNGATFPRGIDEDEEELYLVKTTRGSVLAFPPWWAHFVITEPTPSFMYTMRSTYPGNVYMTLFTRIFVERLTLWNSFPPWNFKTAYENSQDKKDVFQEECQNEITKEHLDQIMELHDNLWDENQP